MKNTAPFTVIIPARLASTRLPDKPLADIGGAPMVVRVAQQALKSLASQVVVAADDVRIVQACDDHGIRSVLTHKQHVSGSDRLSQACEILSLPSDTLVVNVQGDEPLMTPEVINQVAQTLANRADCSLSTVAHAIDDDADFQSPHVVKVVLDHRQTALYFSRAPIPAWRDRPMEAQRSMPSDRPLRHVGIYAYRAEFLSQFPYLAPAPLEILESLEQLRALWHGHRIAVHVTTLAPGQGVDTPDDLQRVRTLWSELT